MVSPYIERTLGKIARDHGDPVPADASPEWWQGYVGSREPNAGKNDRAGACGDDFRGATEGNKS